MTPLELARFVRERIDTHGHDEQIVRALCTQAAVDETRLIAELDPDYINGLDVMVLIKQRADDLYAQIVGK